MKKDQNKLFVAFKIAEVETLKKRTSKKTDASELAAAKQEIEKLQLRLTAEIASGVVMAIELAALKSASFGDRAPSKTENNMLPACPFCKSTTAPRLADSVELRYHVDTEFYGYTVLCFASRDDGGCGATCGFWPTQDEAKDAWSKSSNPAPSADTSLHDRLTVTQRAGQGAA